MSVFETLVASSEDIERRIVNAEAIAGRMEEAARDAADEAAAARAAVVVLHEELAEVKAFLTVADPRSTPSEPFVEPIEPDPEPIEAGDPDPQPEA